MNFRTCEDVRLALRDVRVVQGRIPGGGLDSGHHYTMRDSNGTSLIVEVIGREVITHIDHNDAGRTGFGVVTNSPPFPWQLEALRQVQRKRAFARSAVSVPGNWYSDERFQRIWLLKSGMPHPGSLSAAVAQAFTVMDSVTVPMGAQL